MHAGSSLRHTRARLYTQRDIKDRGRRQRQRQKRLDSRALRHLSWQTGVSVRVSTRKLGIRTREGERKHVTRGHNIVADGWAGAANPHPHPNPHLKYTKSICKACFSTFQLDDP